MKNWHQQWDDFLNEAEEPKLKSSGNVEAHFDQTLSNLTPSQRSEISSALKELFSDKEFSGLFTRYQSNSESLELEEKELVSSRAEDFIRQQGLTGEVDLPGSDASIAFLKTLKDKVGSQMEENYWTSNSSPGPEISDLSMSSDEAIVSATVADPSLGDVSSMVK